MLVSSVIVVLGVMPVFVVILVCVCLNGWWMTMLVSRFDEANCVC